MFTKHLFTIVVPLNAPPPNQESDGCHFELNFVRASNRTANTRPINFANKPSKPFKIANKRNYEQTGVSVTIRWVVPRIVRSVSVRSKWAGLGAQKGTFSAPQPMSSACQRFPIISYEILSGGKKLRRPNMVAITKEGA